MYFEGEVPTVSYGNCNNNGWNDWSWIIGLALVGGLFGNGGFGFGSNRGDFAYHGAPAASQADVRAAVDQQTLISKIDQQTYGLADTYNALNNTIVNGFNGVDNAICTLGYQQAQLINNLSSQLASCCCGIERAIDGVNYNMATNTCAIQTAIANSTRDIIDNQRCSTDRILGYLTNEKISALQAENTALKGQISNDRQTKTIVSELRDGCPLPAYITCNPNAPYGYGYSFPYGQPYGYGVANTCCASVQ